MLGTLQPYAGIAMNARILTMAALLAAPLPALAQAYDSGYGANNSWQGTSSNYGSYNPTPYQATPQQAEMNGNPSGYGIMR